MKYEILYNDFLLLVHDHLLYKNNIRKLVINQLQSLQAKLTHGSFHQILLHLPTVQKVEQ